MAVEIDRVIDRALQGRDVFRGPAGKADVPGTRACSRRAAMSRGPGCYHVPMRSDPVSCPACATVWTPSGEEVAARRVRCTRCARPYDLIPPPRASGRPADRAAWILQATEPPPSRVAEDLSGGGRTRCVRLHLRPAANLLMFLFPLVLSGVLFFAAVQGVAVGEHLMAGFLGTLGAAMVVAGIWGALVHEEVWVAGAELVIRRTLGPLSSSKQVPVARIIHIVPEVLFRVGRPGHGKPVHCVRIHREAGKPLVLAHNYPRSTVEWLAAHLAAGVALRRRAAS